MKYQLADRIVIRELPSQSEVATSSKATSTLVFSPSGKLLASGHDSHVTLWNCESWQEERSLTNAHAPAVFSPDGQWLVTGSSGGHRDGDWLAEQGTGGYDRPG